MGLITIIVDPPLFDGPPKIERFFDRVISDDQGRPRYIETDVRCASWEMTTARTPLVHVDDLKDPKRLRTLRKMHRIDINRARKLR